MHSKMLNDTTTAVRCHHTHYCYEYSYSYGIWVCYLLPHTLCLPAGTSALREARCTLQQSVAIKIGGTYT